MVDTKTIETFLKEANGSIRPGHKIILEKFLRENYEFPRLPGQIKINEWELEIYGNKLSPGDVTIQKYRIEGMKKRIENYPLLQRECEDIMKAYMMQALQEAHS